MKEPEKKEVVKKPGPPAKVRKNLDQRSKDPVKAGKYVVVSAIKEDGQKFLPGDDYTGRWVKRYIEDGQIKKKD